MVFDAKETGLVLQADRGATTHHATTTKTHHATTTTTHHATTTKEMGLVLEADRGATTTKMTHHATMKETDLVLKADHGSTTTTTREKAACDAKMTGTGFLVRRYENRTAATNFDFASIQPASAETGPSVAVCHDADRATVKSRDSSMRSARVAETGFVNGVDVPGHPQ